MCVKARVCFPNCKVVLRSVDDVRVQRMLRALLELLVLFVWLMRKHLMSGPVFKLYVIV